MGGKTSICRECGGVFLVVASDKNKKPRKIHQAAAWLERVTQSVGGHSAGVGLAYDEDLLDL